MKAFKDRCAQGDCMLIRVASIPKNATPVKSDGGYYILAHSETNHHHAVVAKPNVRLFSTDNPLISYLEVVEATDQTETLLKHLRSFDTHETIAIPPGTYEIRRQREYTPEGWRRVAD
ncbi:MAG: hypothetical protein KGI54_13705 [Pseudomonadota bacterium]|nr:hypothetical protein [Pseudomonadota bacterium]